MEDGIVVRYLEINIDGRISWYKDDSDTAQTGDIVIVPYGRYELKAKVVNAVRCM